MGSERFFDQIEQFNEAFGVSAPMPVDLGVERIRNFIRIIGEEVREGHGVADAWNSLDLTQHDKLTALADWLADLTVYAVSELRRWGLPPEVICKLVMKANLTKLGPDGRPIYDDRGKILKGPSFVPPEPEIRALLAVLGVK